jgi:hypothetical protein
VGVQACRRASRWAVSGCVGGNVGGECRACKVFGHSGSLVGGRDYERKLHSMEDIVVRT